jgi:hypothetical protein
MFVPCSLDVGWHLKQRVTMMHHTPVCIVTGSALHYAPVPQACGIPALKSAPPNQLSFTAVPINRSSKTKSVAFSPQENYSDESANANFCV